MWMLGLKGLNKLVTCIIQSNPVNTDAKGATRSVLINEMSILRRFS